jgi:pimeloyl-ACP methyl ester carboxylesterase
MLRVTRRLGGSALALVVVALVIAASASSASAKLGVTWMKSYAAPQTPAKYNKVGVIKVGKPKAKNVLVLEPGTSAGAAYFVPLAKWITTTAPNWQVWSVERRENLLEDQSVLNKVKAGTDNVTQLFNYYLGWIKNPSISPHFHFIPDSSVEFAKQWGMNVAVQDLHTVITAARKLGGKVVLGGHSLGGSVVTAYATWNFAGKPGADQLAGLVFDDGGSFQQGTDSKTAAQTALAKLNSSSTSPWLAFGGITAPFAGLYNATGSLAALVAPNAASLGQSSGLLNGLGITPSVPATNLGQYGYALNVGTSPASLIAAQGHLGKGLVTTGGPPFGWNGAGAITPIKRFATMFSGLGINNVDGTEWYFPARLTLDTSGVNNGIPAPAQKVLGEKSTLGRQLPRTLRMYAFGAALSGPHMALIDATKQLASQSHIPAKNLVLVNHPAYAHNDPAGAFPKNLFFNHLMPFLAKIAAP